MNPCPICQCPIHGNHTVCNCTKHRREYSEDYASKFHTAKKPESSKRFTENRFSTVSKGKNIMGRNSFNDIEKYKYGEKVKEKRNYVLYISGVGYVQKEGEEEEPIQLLKQQQKEEKDDYILEYPKEYLDNYRYYESKDIRRVDPNRKSITIHKRYPFADNLETKVRSSRATQKTNLYPVNGFRENKTFRYYETYKQPIISESERISRRQIPQPRFQGWKKEKKRFCNKREHTRQDLENYYGARQVGEAVSKTRTTKDGDYIIRVTTTRREMERETEGKEEVEVRELIDNYKYKESKNLRKVRKGRESFTHHERLSEPFYVTNKYSNYSAVEDEWRKSGKLKSMRRCESENVFRRENNVDDEEYEFYCPVHGRRSVRSLSKY